MNRKRKTYSVGHLASAVFMIAALLWLTISVAFIVPCQQKQLKDAKSAITQLPTSADEEDNNNPFGNTNEEKASGNTTTFSEEYLHEHHTTDHLVFSDSKIHTSQSCGTYNAFHGEVHVPPPNVG